MSTKEKATELIADYLEMLPTSIDFNGLISQSKIFALYAANTAKWSHPTDSKEWKYWEEVKQEIDLL